MRAIQSTYRYLALTVALYASTTMARDRWTTVAPGVRLLRRTTRHANGAPLVLHVAMVEVCAAGLRMRATAPNETPRRTSTWAHAAGALLAINGDFFDAPGVPLGRARGDGRDFPPRNQWYFGALVVGAAGDVPRISMSYEAPARYTEVVSAQERIVVRGVARIDPHVAHSAHRHPRSAVGWSQDGRTVAFVVVDGRTRDSAGATTPELALILRDLGAWEAVRLDGGGSSTLVVQDRVINHPSDGRERAVANHLGWVRDTRGPPAFCATHEPVVVAESEPDASLPFPASARPARITSVFVQASGSKSQ